MTPEQMLAILRRSKLTIIGVPKAKYVKSLNKNISYQTLPKHEKQSRKAQVEPSTELSRHKLGPSPALPRSMPDTRITPIGNIKPSDDTDDFPDKYQLELYRLHAKVRHLESDIKDKDGRLLKALTALDDELMFWRTGLNCHVWETYDEIRKRMNRIVGAIDYLKDTNPHVCPPLEVLARWRKQGAP